MINYEKAAIQAIGIVDYDIMKECQEQIEEENDSDMVTEMSRFLEELISDCEFEYSGAMADIDSLVQAFYKACPDNKFLNENYPKDKSPHCRDIE